MKKFLPVIVIVIILLAALAGSARGDQTAPAQLILTWHANNFYPSDFPGKPLPTPGTAVRVAAEAVAGSKFLNLSSAAFLWYVDGQLLSEGKGLKEIQFTTRTPDRGYHLVRVEIKNGAEAYEGATSIPVVAPRVTLAIPFASRSPSPGDEVAAYAVPYFFNVVSLSDLRFFWFINGVRETSSANASLNLKMGTPHAASENTVELKVLAVNALNQLESAVDTATVTVQTSIAP